MLSSMKKYWGAFWTAGVLTLVAVGIAALTHVSAQTVVRVAIGAVSFYWLLIITTVPWNLHFRARQVRHEIGDSRARGIRVEESRDAEVRALERRLLRFAVAGHVVSAAVTATVTFFSGHVLGYWIAGFFLLSTLFRPAGAYFAYLRARIATLLKETKFPRDDVLELKQQITTLNAELEAHRTATTEALERAFRELDGLRADLRTDTARLRDDVRLARESAENNHSTALNRATIVEQRLTTMTHHFGQTLDGLSDQQELITGLRAFLRLVKAETTP